jgi:hypothetical protein
VTHLLVLRGQQPLEEVLLDLLARVVEEDVAVAAGVSEVVEGLDLVAGLVALDDLLVGDVPLLDGGVVPAPLHHVVEHAVHPDQLPLLLPLVLLHLNLISPISNIAMDKRLVLVDACSRCH